MMSYYNIAASQQAAFRQTSPTISEHEQSPTDPPGLRNGHLLALGCEDENLYPTLRGENGARKFFADRDIKWHSHRQL